MAREKERMPGGWGEGFRSAQEMLPVLRTLLSQLGSEERAVRLLGVSVSNLMPARSTLQGDLTTALTLWEENWSCRDIQASKIVESFSSAEIRNVGC